MEDLDEFYIFNDKIVDKINVWFMKSLWNANLWQNAWKYTYKNLTGLIIFIK